GYCLPCYPMFLDRRSAFFFQAEDGIRDFHVTGVQTCALPICSKGLQTNLMVRMEMRKRNAKDAPHQPQALKQMNKRLILQTIRRRQPVSRSEIADETAISRTTVSQLTDELLQEGWIREVGQGLSGTKGGRKPITLSINDDAAWVVGVDIGGCGTTAALCNLAGQVKSITSFSSPPTSGLDSLVEQLEHFLSQADPEVRIIGLGIGAPGITRSADGVVVSAPALGWTDVHLKRLLEERL